MHFSDSRLLLSHSVTLLFCDSNFCRNRPQVEVTNPEVRKKKNYEKKITPMNFQAQDGATGTSVNASLYSALSSPTLARGGRRLWVMITLDRASPPLPVCSGCEYEIVSEWESNCGWKPRGEVTCASIYAIQQDVRWFGWGKGQRLSANTLADTQVGSLLGQRISCAFTVCRF